MNYIYTKQLVWVKEMDNKTSNMKDVLGEVEAAVAADEGATEPTSQSENPWVREDKSQNTSQQSTGPGLSRNAYKTALKKDFPDTDTTLSRWASQQALKNDAKEYTALSKAMDSIDNGPKERNTGNETLVAALSREQVETYRQQLLEINLSKWSKTKKDEAKEQIYKELESIQKANSPVKGKDLRQQAITELSKAGELDSKTRLNLSKMAKENPRKLIVGVLTTAMLGALFPPALPFIFLGVAAVVAVKTLEYLSNWWNRESKIQEKVDEIADKVQDKNAQKIIEKASTPLLQQAETEWQSAKNELAAAQAEEKAIQAEIKNNGQLIAIKNMEDKCRGEIAKLEVKLIEVRLTVPKDMSTIERISAELTERKEILSAADELRKEVMKTFSPRIIEVKSKIQEAESKVADAKQAVTQIKTTYGISSTQKPTAPSPGPLGPTARASEIQEKYKKEPDRDTPTGSRGVRGPGGFN